jgi:CHASE2 domain-containing sensor protein
MLRSWWRKWAAPLTQGTLASLISIGTVLLWNTADGRSLDHWVLRHFFLFRGALSAPPDVILVAIDDETYGKLSASTNFPLPRHFLADAFEEAEKASAKTIILDAKIPSQPNLEPEADDRIEAALRAGPTAIWTGEMPSESTEANGNSLATSAVLRSDERFRNAAKLELPMIVGGEDDLVMYISDSTTPEATLYERVPIAKALVELAHLKSDAPGPNDLINFYGPKGTLKRISLYKLLGDDAATFREMLRDKIVLLGYQSIAHGRGPSNKDEYDVPVSNFPMYGLEIHGNIIGNLIDRSWLRRLSEQTESMLLLFSTILMAGSGLRLKPSRGVPLVAGVAFVLLLADYYLFAFRRLWISGIGPFLLAAAATCVVIALYRIASTERFRERMKRALGFDLKD